MKNWITEPTYLLVFVITNLCCNLYRIIGHTMAIDFR